MNKKAYITRYSKVTVFRAWRMLRGFRVSGFKSVNARLLPSPTA